MLTLSFLLLDPVNLSIGSFIYGGDANGIAVSFGLNQYMIRAAFFGLFLLDRELVVQKLFPLYNVETKHPLFQPLLKWRGKSE